jgi:A/G-specific adenine glycosylase
MSNNQLLKWYGLNQRDLPWRKSTDPYIIWLSEIILQQTRVQQGLPYFLNFQQKYPQVFDLANASEEEVLKLWQGLGYYIRARNMHYTAKLIVSEFKGVFPNSYSGLIQLKGIGTYTAAAIASFAFNEPVAVLDGNVFRVLSRFFAQSIAINSTTGKKLFAQLAQDFLNKKYPATHNQAMMELGSLICTPQNPDCLNCPLNNNCLAHSLQQESSFPVKDQKVKVKERKMAYFHFQLNDKVAIYQRPAGDIWQNLFDLPNLILENEDSMDYIFKELLEKDWIKPNDTLKLVYKRKHLLSHRRIFADFYLINLSENVNLGLNEIWVKPSELTKYGISRLFQHYFESL